MNEFKIMFSSELIKSEYHESPGILEDEVSKLTYAIFSLRQLYERSRWSILLGSQEYQFTFDEIPLIWDEIPENLNQIVNGNSDPVWFTFIQQENDKAVVVEKLPSADLLVSVIGAKYHPLYWKYAYGGGKYTFDDLTPQRIIVSKQHFLNEWKNFTFHILEVLKASKFIQEDEESVKEFIEQLPTN